MYTISVGEQKYSHQNFYSLSIAQSARRNSTFIKHNRHLYYLTFCKQDFSFLIITIPPMVRTHVTWMLYNLSNCQQRQIKCSPPPPYSLSECPHALPSLFSLYFHEDDKLSYCHSICINFTLLSKDIQTLYISFSSILIIINDHTFVVSFNTNRLM
jgi:hypothetical protein